MAGIAIAAALGFGWWVVISVMTQVGFSGNDRYLILGAALVEIAGGVGFGWAALEITHLLSRRMHGASARLAGGIGTWVVAGAIGACFLLVPSWIGGLVHVRKIHKALVYQAHLRTDLAKVVDEVGGPARVRRCGSVMTEGFQVPMVAWALGVHTLQVGAPPTGGSPPPAPNVIFRTRAQRNATPLPLLSDWPNVHYQRVAHVRTFSAYSNCIGNVTL
jgi:hypothetical protein